MAVPVTTPDLFGPTLTALQQCVENALNANERPVGRSVISPGNSSAWDDCCEGQLSVRLVQMYPTAGGQAAFPAQDTRPKCSPNLLSVRVEVEVIRCAAVLDNQGKPPLPAAVTNDGLATSHDASIIFTALMCCLMNGVTGVQTWVIDRWDPRGTQGGCTGGAWQVLLGLGHCGCPED